jgi:cephalosporin hydroxylase
MIEPTRENLDFALRIGTHAPNFFGGNSLGEGYHVQQNPWEMAAFLTLTQKHAPKRYLEIGSASGGFIRALYERVPFEFGMMIDNGAYQAEMQEKNIEAFKDRVKCVICDSHGPEAKAALEGEAPFDLILIDGDHSYEGVIQDVALVLPYAHKNTLICFHDVNCKHVPGVRQAYDEVIASGKLREVGVIQTRDELPNYFGIAVTRLT